MNAINKAIYDQLAGGTALITALGGTAIYHLQAPDNVALPVVVFSWAGGGDTNETPATGQTVVEFVRVYHTNAYQAGVIDDLVRARLHKQSFSVTGGTAIWCAREDDYESVEQTASGVQVYTMGGNYRIAIT